MVVFFFKKKQTLWPLFKDGFQLSQGYRATMRRQFTFYCLIPRSSWCSFDRPRNDERLSCPWSHSQWFWTWDLGLVIQCLNHSVIALFRKEPQRIQGDIANLTFTDLSIFQYPSSHFHEWQSQRNTLVTVACSHMAVFIKIR